MRITLEQYPGFVQNLETLATVDLSDNDQAMLMRLIALLIAALANVENAIIIQGDAPEPPF